MVAGELLKAGGAGKWSGRALLDRAESLGSTLDVTTQRDATRISLSVTRPRLADALELLAAVATAPRLDATELRKLLARERERVASLARTSGAFAASMVLYRELYSLPASMHPYARYDALPADLDRISLGDCRRFRDRALAPEALELVIAGDVDAAALPREVEASFAKLRGAPAPEPSFTDPLPPEGLRLFLVDRPASTQAEILVGTFGPERRSPRYPALRAAVQVVGGGVAGRLFLDVREKRSLAYRTRASVEPVAHGPTPVVLSAATQTARAGLAVAALLEHHDALGREAPRADETETATRYLSDVFLVGVGTVRAVATMTADLRLFSLPDSYYDDYRAEVRALGADAVFATARETFRPGSAVVVVAGDAATLARPLSRLGRVHVIDADAGFSTRAVVEPDPGAELALPEAAGR